MKYLAFLVLYFSAFVAFAQLPDTSSKVERYKPYIFIFERGGKQIIFERGEMIVFRSNGERQWNVGFIESIEPAYLNLLVNNTPIQFTPADISAVKFKKYRPYSGLVQAGAGILPVAGLGYPLIALINSSSGPSVYYTSAGLLAGGLLLQLVTMPRRLKVTNGWKGQIVQADGVFYRTKISGYDKP
ncbi:MAG: hypothetical protein ACOVMN_07580 [Flexibacteraceae bacterium]